MKRSWHHIAALLARRALGASPARLVPLLLLAALIWIAWSSCRPSPPGESLTPSDVAKLHTALLARVKRGGPNHLHSRRLFHYAPPFAAANGASVGIVRAAALLHDATKEDGAGEPKDRFCSHGEQGAEYAMKVLQEIGKSSAFRERSAAAVREHMGPCGFNWRFFSRRFMSKFCGGSFPKPSSPESEVLYDIDMLDLMTVDGVVKVVELRQTNPEFAKEPLKDSVVSGADSAWKSVVDAKQTLITSEAQRCGGELATHTGSFVDGIDFTKVTDLAAFKKAAAEYLAAHPLPSCLPVVPPWDGSTL